MDTPKFINHPAPPHKYLAFELFQIYRNRAGLTQAELAEAVGLHSRRMVQYWEAGSSLPKPATLKRMLEFFIMKRVLLVGQEGVEARQLWATVKAAYDSRLDSLTPYPVLDEAWLAGLIAQPSKPPPTTDTSSGTQENGSGPNQGDNTLQKPGKPALPLALTSFIGRNTEMTELRRLLLLPQSTVKNEFSSSIPARLITLTGIGGIGKTRLALEVATSLANQFEGGVGLVELAPLTDPFLIPQFIAEALDFTPPPGKPLLPSLLAYLSSCQLLIILDNCEHLIKDCAKIAEQLLKSCPQVQILATSREPLHIGGEVIWPLAPLTLEAKPLQAHEIIKIEMEEVQSEAIRLFVDRASQVNPNFRLTTQNWTALVELCRQLEGLPLALELAAARIRVLTVEQLNAGLKESFQLLSKGTRTALPRHQSFTDLLDWSYKLLSLSEQQLFRQLSVLPGNWDLQVIEAIGLGSEIEAEAQLNGVFELVEKLVEKSLVVVEEEELEAARRQATYRILEPIRQYGQHKLKEAGEEQPWEKVANYLSEVGDNAEKAKDYNQARLGYTQALDALTRIKPAPARLRQQCDILIKLASRYGSTGRDPHQLLVQLDQLENQLVPLVEVEKSSEDRLRLAYIHQWMGSSYFNASNYKEGIRYLKLAKAEAEALGREELAAYSSMYLGLMLVMQGFYREGLPVLSQASQKLEQAGKLSEKNLADLWVAIALAGLGHSQEALREVEQVAKTARQMNDLINVVNSTVTRCAIYEHFSDFPKIVEYAKLAIEEATPLAVQSLTYLGLVSKARGLNRLAKLEAAQHALAEAQALRQKLGGSHFYKEAHRGLSSLGDR